LSQKREGFETLRIAIPVTFLFPPYMEPLCYVSRGKTGEGDTGKRDYRHRSQNVRSLSPNVRQPEWLLSRNLSQRMPLFPRAFIQVREEMESELIEACG
jgi:hypothetical protein